MPFRAAYSGAAVSEKWSLDAAKKFTRPRKRISSSPEAGSINALMAYTCTADGRTPSLSTL